MARGLLVVIFLLSSLALSKATTCVEARTSCATDRACTDLFVAYLGKCSVPINTGQECEEGCKTAYNDLIANSKGSAFDGCDCDTIFCSIASCFRGNGNGNGNNDDLSCQTILGSCFTDITCKPFFDAIVTDCSTAVMVGGSCSDACKFSYSNLIANSIGKYFNSCPCRVSDTWCTDRTNIANNCYDGKLPDSSSSLRTVASMLVVLTFSIMGALLLFLA
jgi:hypothetical protein